MKNKIFKGGLVFSLIGIWAFSLLIDFNGKTSSFDVEVAIADPKSGKWIAEYGGGSTPFRCTCASSLTKSDCIVGDTTSNTSLCE